MGEKTGNIVIVYAAVAVLSVLLMIFYLFLEKKRERKFLYLTTCVAILNCGYFMLSVAPTLLIAKIANGVSYFGAAYSVLSILYVVMDVCQLGQKKWVRGIFLAISTCAFLLAASSDYLGLYYKSVDIATVNGATHLVKDYSPLHILYTIYLLSYVLLMVGLIVYSAAKKRLSSPKYTLLLLAAVLMNLGVWAVEQGINVDFEFLSVSYIVTEVMLILIYGMLRDYGLVQPGGALVSVQMLTQLNTRKSAGELPAGMEDMFSMFAQKVKTLSSAEHRILNYYIQGHEIADIPELAYISIHTVKKHNRSIYQKLEVASRDELMLYIEMFRCCGRLHELTGEHTETE